MHEKSTGILFQIVGLQAVEQRRVCLYLPGCRSRVRPSFCGFSRTKKVATAVLKSPARGKLLPPTLTAVLASGSSSEISQRFP